MADHSTSDGPGGLGATGKESNTTLPQEQFSGIDRFGVYTMKDRRHKGPAEMPPGAAQAPLIGWALARYLFRDIDAAANADELAHKYEWAGFEYAKAAHIPLADRLRILRDEADTYIDLVETDRPVLNEQSANSFDDEMETKWHNAVEGLRSIARLAEAFYV